MSKRLAIGLLSVLAAVLGVGFAQVQDAPSPACHVALAQDEARKSEAAKRVQLAVEGFAAEGKPLIKLWPDGAPGAKGTRAEDTPQMAVFAPKKPNGAAVIVCPGGGYGVLMTDYEGRQIALALNRWGVTAFVLFYRLGSQGYHHPAQLLIYQRGVHGFGMQPQDEMFAHWPDLLRLWLRDNSILSAKPRAALDGGSVTVNGRPVGAGAVTFFTDDPLAPVATARIRYGRVLPLALRDGPLQGRCKIKVLYSVLDVPGRPAPTATDGMIVATRRAPGDAEEMTVKIGASGNVLKLELTFSTSRTTVGWRR